MSKFARSKKARDTAYLTFATPHSQRAGSGSAGTIDKDIGISPITRWFAFVLNNDEAVSIPSSPAVGMVFDCALPPGTLIMDAMVRLDEAFDGTGNNDVDIGDVNDGDGWADGLDFTTAVTTDAVWFRDVSAGYMAYSDIVKGTSGPQYYPDGGTIRVLVGTADDMTVGKAILFLKTISYNELQGAE